MPSLISATISFIIQIVALIIIYIFCRKRADKYDFKHYENSEILKKINQKIRRHKGSENIEEIETLKSEKQVHEKLAIKYKKKEKISMPIFYIVLLLWIIFQIVGTLYLLEEIRYL